MPHGLKERLRWPDLYSEAEFYKAAVRTYTKPIFNWRKALISSSDEKTLHDLAGKGLRGLDAIHRELRAQRFHFRPGLALHRNFNGKHRTLYIYPWEERIVDLLLYRILNSALHHWFSPFSFAYRDRTYGLDCCQSAVARAIRGSSAPVFIAKRDVADFFASINHSILLAQLRPLIAEGDYLWDLLCERIRFRCFDEGEERVAERGVPFGTAIACMLANIYLTELDRKVCAQDVAYFRYADDLLLLSRDRGALLAAREKLDDGLAELKLESKPAHQLDVVLSATPVLDNALVYANKFRHLGLEFRADGSVGLSRDKVRKIRNLFRFAFRRARARLRRAPQPEGRAGLAAQIAAQVLARGIRNVAIVDYYLTHVDDEQQLRHLDRWLAEEVLSLAYGGHRKGNFRKLSYAQLRAIGLPSLVHRRRLIAHGKIEAPFFIWKQQQSQRSGKGMVARRRARPSEAAFASFSPHPEAAAQKSS